jgi:hypothetical protein
MTKPSRAGPTREQLVPKWADATSDELEEGLLHALDGEHYAERCLIEYFSERMAAGQSYDLRVLERYLTVVFRQALKRTAGKDDAELLLRRERGRPADDSIVDRDRCLAAAALVRIRNGTAWETACEEAAALYDGASDRQAQRALAKHESDIETLSDIELQLLMDSFEDSLPLKGPI